MADLKAFAEQLVNLTVKEVNELATILKVGSSGLAIKTVVQFIVGVSIGGILGRRNGIIRFFLFAAEGVVRQRGGGASIQCHTSAQSDAQQS